ncbi:MAG: Asp-tRNA(Asn)/Glu-tRNA(Gln) amidotransferase subunit GatC [Coriobacteriaceae bacterium]|nr:Asp-tRNA(Asn)/Glu-tRNA(Gln) amidotransferase subunit GatC [Coriobacteriaceae bacterium]
MALTEDDVRAIANYATIALDDTELTEMTAYLNNAVEMLEPVLAYGDQDVEPTFHSIGDLANVMRSDCADAERALPTEEALANAGASREGQFRVPSILGGGE